MLAVCLQNGWDIETYLEPTHPLQREILGIMAGVMRVPIESIVLGTDGCSLPTFGAPIGSFAVAYAALARSESARAGSDDEYAGELRRLAAAMVAHPANVSGHGELVANLMELGAGTVVAKSGAEGLLCLSLPSLGYGVAIRIMDGSFRAHAVIAAQVLRDLDVWPDEVLDELMERHSPRLHNHNGLHVGDLRASFELEMHQ